MALTLAAAIGAGYILKTIDEQYNLLLASDFQKAQSLLPIVIQSQLFNLQNKNIVDHWESAVDNFSDRYFTESIEEPRKWKYGEFDRLVNRLSHWLRDHCGIKPKDIVALFMLNRPEYVAVWLAVAKIGGITALINTNIRGAGFEHCVQIAKAKLLIYGPGLDIDELKKLPIPVASFCLPAKEKEAPWAAVVEHGITMASDERPSKTLRAGIKSLDPALLVYTSGTTGLPKAATVSHFKVFYLGALFASGYKLNGNDRIYTVLPLYHSSGGVCGVSMAIYLGATLITKVKFSASQFWDDCRKCNATVVQYIGELCRYLILQPPTPRDMDHNVRIAVGNGLRPDIWNEFQDRFGISEIGEFYGATEGNTGLYNHCTTLEDRGTLGASGPIVQHLLKVKLARYDVEKDDLIRDKEGKLIECGPDEVGELLGFISTIDPLRAFAGYYGNEKSTNSKIIKDAFVQGDQYFRTGDLLKQDKKRRWYFVDRIGDTFRFKGENVSTNEVSEVLSQFPGMQEANVYGVELPGVDGRGCMAAITFIGDLDFAALSAHCVKNLPSYAVPLFLRIQNEMEHTGTFKQQKVQLRKEGINPSLVGSDKLYKWAGKTYQPFGDAAYVLLKEGKSKL